MSSPVYPSPSSTRSSIGGVLWLGERGKLVAGAAHGEPLVVLVAEEEVGKEVTGEEVIGAEEEEEGVVGRELERGEEVGRECSTTFRRTSKHS